MALVDVNRRPSRLEQRIFGMLFVLFFGLAGALVLWRTGSQPAARVLWILGGSVGLIYYAVPALRWPLYVGWTRLTFPLGWLVSHTVMVLLYFGVVTPFGVVMRLLGQDPMQRRLRTGAPTYWTQLEPARDRRRYFRQS